METAVAGAAAPATPVVPTGLYPTGDGHVVIAAGTDPQFVDFCAALDRRDLLADPRFARLPERARHRAEIDAIIREILGARPTAHWMARFAEHDVPAEPVNDYAALRADPHVRETGLYRDLAQPGFGPLPLPVTPGLGPSPPSGPCPRVGEHSRAVLAELGWTAAAIDAAVAAGNVVG
jgi:crotonobetainyl-CoA:carnitine CoA-transferase CaiB-like acyl-CoA transferase